MDSILRQLKATSVLNTSVGFLMRARVHSYIITRSTPTSNLYLLACNVSKTKILKSMEIITNPMAEFFTSNLKDAQGKAIVCKILI